MNTVGKLLRGYLISVGCLYLFIFVAVVAFSFNVSSTFVATLTVISLLMTVLSAFTIPFINKSLLPIIPSKSFWGTALTIMMVINVAFFFLGDEWTESLSDQAGLFQDQQADAGYICLIEEGPFYSKKSGGFIRAKNISAREGFLTGERDVQKGRSTMAKVRVGDSVTGDFYWVPVSRVTKKTNQLQSALGGEALDGKKKKEQPKKEKKITRVVTLTSAEIYQQDLFGDSVDKIKLKFFKKFKKGDTVAFQEDFCLPRVGGPSEALTILWANNRKVKNFPGNCIPAGTRFQVRESPLLLLFQAYGASSVSLGKLTLKKVN